MRVYPNPVAAVLTVAAGQEIANVTVFNLLGQKVLDRKTTGTEVEVNVESLVAGTYLLQITSATGSRATSRIVKQ